MSSLRVLLFASVVSSLVVCLAAGCGGSLSPGVKGDDAGQDVMVPPSGDDGGPVPTDGPGACEVSGPCTTGAQCCSAICSAGRCAGPTNCQPDGVPCVSPAQCCSQTCDQNTCGGVIVSDGGPPPSCEADGSSCTSYAQCCSGVCNQGLCGSIFVDASPPPMCTPDGYGCNTWQECCTGVCAQGVCGGGFVDSGPSCFPNGYGCSTWQECCSNDCNTGVCGGVTPPFDGGFFDGGVFDAGPPPMCAPTGPSACDACVAGACCPQLSACESDPICIQAQKCFDGCYVPGQGAACEQKCAQAYPSAAGQNLLTCAAQSCGPTCQ